MSNQTERFNSLQTGRYFRTILHHSLRQWMGIVSIPFKREGISERQVKKVMP